MASHKICVRLLPRELRRVITKHNETDSAIESACNILAFLTIEPEQEQARHVYPAY